MTNFYIPNSIDWTQESCYFRNQDSILSYPFELAQNFKNHLDILASYPFSKIELTHEYDHEPQVGNSSSLFDSIMTPIFLLDFFSILELTLNPVPVNRELESPIFYDHSSLIEQVCEHQFFSLDPILNQFRLSLLNQDLI